MNESPSSNQNIKFAGIEKGMVTYMSHSSFNMASEKLSIRMFGGFELLYNGKKLEEGSSRSHKMWNLLGYLITYHERKIPQSEFIDILWSDAESSNPVSALKTLFSRLRTFLETITPKNESLILSSVGSYQWNNRIHLQLDTELFEDLVKKGSDIFLSNKQRISYYIEAITMYQGDFLPMHKDELWVTCLSTYYHSLFVETSKALATLLEQETMYEEMILYCTKAIQIEHFDEKLHCKLISALIRQGNQTAALKHYAATEMLYKNHNIKSYDELRGLYLNWTKSQTELETNLSMIQQQLKETQGKPGAFVCEYSVFREIYCLEARHSFQSNDFMYIGIIRINQNNEIPPLNILKDAMEKLLESISRCLRSRDVVSKYKDSHYIIMLPSITYKNSINIMEQIAKDYYYNNRKSLLEISYKLKQMNGD